MHSIIEFKKGYCPFSVMEFIQYGTPVLGADIGGIPESAERYAEGCRNKKFITLEEYTREMGVIYNG